VLSNGVMMGLQVTAAVVLARLIHPDDYGLVTMVTTLSLLLVNCGANGITEAVIQRPAIDHRLISNLFWINTTAGAALTIGFAMAASTIARLYGDPAVAKVAVAVAPSIVLTSISVLHLSLLRRAMRFTVVSAIDVAARAGSVFLSIALAWAGWGWRALVAGVLIQPVVTTIGAWAACHWIPGPPRRAIGTGSTVKFSVNVYARFAINYTARNLDNVLIGRYFSAEALGFYKKAYDLFALSTGQLVTPLTSVALSAFSRMPSGSDQHKRYLLSAIGMLGFVGMGLSGVLTLAGPDVIRLLLGPAWGPTGQIFRYFGPGIGAMVIYYTHGWIHLSIGTSDRWLRWGLIEVGLTGLLFLIGLPWGPNGIAIAWSASFWILMLPAFWYAGQPIQLGCAALMNVVGRYVVAWLIALAVAATFAGPLPMAARTPFDALVDIARVCPVFISVYLAVVILLHRGLGPLRELGEILRMMTHRASGHVTRTEPLGAN
jgi:PST family polysaccharide transporter